MQKHLNRIIDEFQLMPKSIVEVVAAYILYLMLESNGHRPRLAARLSGKHESSFSRMLNRPDNLTIAKGCLNRAVRRRLAALGKKANKTQALVIVNATLMGRHGKYVKNIGFYKLGRKTVCGHKIVNFVLVLGDEIIPLSAVAHYPRGYCEENGFTYKTENELVIDWLNWLHASELFPKEWIKHLHFACDAVYDAKKVQKAIDRIGCHFTMCVKCTRQIDGIAIDEYFRRQKIIPWQSIRLFARKDGKTVRKEYRIRMAPEVRLKGFGLVTAVLSEMKRRDGKKSSKYIVSSDPSLSAREIVETYRRRWAIETWHKEMQQEHGFGDCRSSSFRAFETHINFCLGAYNLQRCYDPGLPKPGTTVMEYATVKRKKDASACLNQFNGVDRFKKAANEALEAIISQKAA